MLELDHLAVAARSLAEGKLFVEKKLGIQLQPGGRHGRYGTHNLLARLEDGLYLEVIAIDPGAETPLDPRWFRLDEFDGPPCLHNWICRSEDMAADLPQMPAGVGRAVSLERGELRWQMAVPEDGRLPYDEMCPAPMQWQSSHPALLLQPTGARLQRLLVRHPQAQDLASRLTPILSDPRVVFETADQPGLSAEFEVDGKVRCL